MMKPNEESNQKDSSKMVLYIGVNVRNQTHFFTRYKLLKVVGCPLKWNIPMIGVCLRIFVLIFDLFFYIYRRFGRNS